MRGLIIGAGVTGCFTAALLQEKGLEVALLARGEKAQRLDRDGLMMRDGITGRERIVRLRVVQSPVSETYDYVMVCVQQGHRADVVPLVAALPGRATVWLLGNTTEGFDHIGDRLGRDRVLGGFPGVGGTWDGDVLVYADREKKGDRPFDRLIVGEAFPEAAAAAQGIHDHFSGYGLDVERYVPIMAWHWCHVALVVPLAWAYYHSGGDLESLAADRPLVVRAVRGTATSLSAVRRAGYPILPGRLNLFRWMPAPLLAGRVQRLIGSRFGRIALAGHASVARDEMRSLAADLMRLADGRADGDLRALLTEI